MLSHLLSSKPKTNLVNLFLAHPTRSFSSTELRLSCNCPSKLLKATLKELTKMEFLNVTEKKKIKYYQMNRHFPLYAELINLLRKVKKVPQDLLVKQLVRMKECKFIALTGIFIGRPRIETDVLFVGKISSAKLNRFLKQAEKFAEQEISYSILTPQEFEYRRLMNDRFVKNILENNPIIVIDKKSKVTRVR
jgi:DNA-binding HxlR family transcriptional regulator